MTRPSDAAANFDDWFAREGKIMSDGGCSAETVARAAYFVAAHNAKNAHDGRVGFVLGAKWQHHKASGFTTFPGELDEMEAEAYRTYPAGAGDDLRNESERTLTSADAKERIDAEAKDVAVDEVRDAMRYRWLVENAVIETKSWRHDGSDPASTKQPVDNAIDAAIASAPTAVEGSNG